MNLEGLREELSYFTDPGNSIGAVLYFVLHPSEGDQILRRADIDEQVQTELKKQFLDYIRNKFLENEEISLLPVTASDRRNNVIYQYDLEHPIEELACMDEITDEIPRFDFRSDSLNTLYGYLVQIGDEERQLVIYKKHHPVNLLRRDSILRIVPANNRFNKLNVDALAIDPGFDFFKLNDTLFITRMKTLERFFGFTEIIQREAGETLALVTESGLIENPEELESLLANKTTARKLIGLHSSAILSMERTVVSGFIQGHAFLSKRIRLNEETGQIKIDTEVSKKLFLKLMNDDYLKSELTQANYDSLAKDKLE